MQVVLSSMFITLVEKTENILPKVLMNTTLLFVGLLLDLVGFVITKALNY